jgi:circadian clock protein KaiC
MPGERFLTIQMHELLTYLGERGVLTFVVVNQHGIVGSGIDTPVDLSYLADSVLLLRYFEYAGRVRKSVAVVKVRNGGHEDSIREFRISADGIEVGQPLTDFQGVLSGQPLFIGAGPLLREMGREGGRSKDGRASGGKKRGRSDA